MFSYSMQNAGSCGRLAETCSTSGMKRSYPTFTQNTARCSVRSRNIRCSVVQEEVSITEAPVTADRRVTEVRSTVTRRIKELGRAGRPKDAVTELAEMAKMGVQPDTQAATALLDACARNGKMDMAMTVFEEIFGDILVPDDVAFSILVRGHGKSTPPAWTAISSLLTLMSQKYSLAPTTAIYNALLDICARTRDEQRGNDVIARMAASQVSPDEWTWETVKNRKALRSQLRRTFGPP